jgi:hypothetical protein
VHGVKFADYFDELTAANGALRLVPGSHHPEQHARLAAYRDRRMPVRTDAEAAVYQASFPGYVTATVPGDVIAFDPAHLAREHRRPGPAGLDGRVPASPRGRVRARADPALGAHGFEQAFRGFDRGRYPTWRDWLADAAAHPRRAAVIERMRQAGVLDLPGAQDGW